MPYRKVLYPLIDPWFEPEDAPVLSARSTGDDGAAGQPLANYGEALDINEWRRQRGLPPLPRKTRARTIYQA